jgi:hypothetical protein
MQLGAASTEQRSIGRRVHRQGAPVWRRGRAGMEEGAVLGQQVPPPHVHRHRLPLAGPRRPHEQLGVPRLPGPQSRGVTPAGPAVTRSHACRVRGHAESRLPGPRSRGVTPAGPAVTDAGQGPQVCDAPAGPGATRRRLELPVSSPAAPVSSPAGPVSSPAACLQPHHPPRLFSTAPPASSLSSAAPASSLTHSITCTPQSPARLHHLHASITCTPLRRVLLYHSRCRRHSRRRRTCSHPQSPAVTRSHPQSPAVTRSHPQSPAQPESPATPHACAHA